MCPSDMAATGPAKSKRLIAGSLGESITGPGGGWSLALAAATTAVAARIGGIAKQQWNNRRAAESAALSLTASASGQASASDHQCRSARYAGASVARVRVSFMRATGRAPPPPVSGERAHSLSGSGMLGRAGQLLDATPPPLPRGELPRLGRGAGGPQDALGGGLPPPPTTPPPHWRPSSADLTGLYLTRRGGPSMPPPPNLFCCCTAALPNQ